MKNNWKHLAGDLAVAAAEETLKVWAEKTFWRGDILMITANFFPRKGNKLEKDDILIAINDDSLADSQAFLTKDGVILFRRMYIKMCSKKVNL